MWTGLCPGQVMAYCRLDLRTGWSEDNVDWAVSGASHGIPTTSQTDVQPLPNLTKLKVVSYKQALQYGFR